MASAGAHPSSAMPARKPPGPGSAASDPLVVTASTTTRSPLNAPVDPVEALARRPDEIDELIRKLGDTPAPAPMPEEPVTSPARPAPASTTPPLGASTAWRDTADTKQKARWLLELAREQIRKGHFDIAERALAEARSLDVKWTVFDETPDRMTDALNKAKDKAKTAAQPPPHDRRTARARLKEARAALAANKLDRAEQLVAAVRSWNVGYGLFDDTPDKVASAIVTARRREALRNAELMARTRDRGVERAATGPAAPAAPAASGARDRTDPN